MSDRGEDRHDDPMTGSPAAADPVSRLRTALDRIAFALDRRKTETPPEAPVPPPGPDMQEVLASIDLLMTRINDVLETRETVAAAPVHEPPADHNPAYGQPVADAYMPPSDNGGQTFEPAQFPVQQYEEPFHNPQTGQNGDPSFTEGPYQNNPPMDSHHQSPSWNDTNYSSGYESGQRYGGEG